MSFRAVAGCGLAFIVGVLVAAVPRGGAGIPLRIVYPDEPAKVHVKVTIDGGKVLPFLPFLRPRGEETIEALVPRPARDNYGVDVWRLNRERASYGPGFVRE